MKFICLANSKREGGRCIAGLILDDDGKPTKKWIRPIKPNGSTIALVETKNIELLSVVKIINPQKVAKFKWRPEDYFYTKLIPSNQKISINELENLYNNDSELVRGKYANWNYATTFETKNYIEKLNSSLALIKGEVIDISKERKVKINNIEKNYTGFKTLEELQRLKGKVVFACISIGEQHYQATLEQPPLHYKLFAEIFPAEQQF